jgi:transposase
MEMVAVIRHKVLTEGVPLREVARELGVSRNTIRRYVRGAAVPPRRPPGPRARPARDALAAAAAEIWAARRTFTAGKQRLTAQRLGELLAERGLPATARTVRRLVADLRRGDQEVTVPLVYAPGEVAQVDFFEVWIDLAAVRQKAWLFVLRLMHSGRDFAMVCARQDTTWFLAAHVAAFAHLAGVVAAIAYDNLTAAVARVLVGQPRVLRPRFAAFVAHYGLEPRFCRPGTGHDKGGVERRGGHIRHQHLVPVPSGATLGAINAALQARLDAQFAAAPPRAAAWAREAAALRPLPAAGFDPSEVRPLQLTHHARVLLGGATYSVPSTWCGHAIEVRLGPETVVLAYAGAQVVHPRLAAGGRSIDYQHLLVPLATKPQALRQVARELVAQFGDPWGALWAALCQRHSPDEIEAARRFAPWLHLAAREGLAAVGPQIATALRTGALVAPPDARPPAPPPPPVPAALRDYVVEAPDLRRYDALGAPAQEVA